MFVECEWLASPLLCVVTLSAHILRGLGMTVFLCASVNESRLGWSVSEWRGREFSGEDFAGQGVVSIIQGKHWAAWLHALDVTKAGRGEMDETMRLLLACLPARLHLPPALPIFSSSFFSFSPLLCNSSEGLSGDWWHWTNLWVALLVSAVSGYTSFRPGFANIILPVTCCQLYSYLCLGKEKCFWSPVRFASKSQKFEGKSRALVELINTKCLSFLWGHRHKELSDFFHLTCQISNSF